MKIDKFLCKHKWLATFYYSGIWAILLILLTAAGVVFGSIWILNNYTEQIDKIADWFFPLITSLIIYIIYPIFGIVASILLSMMFYGMWQEGKLEVKEKCKRRNK